MTYCGHEMDEFVPQRTCAYIGQHDLHHGEMTVRETLDFSGRCLGVGTRYEMLAELSKREREAGIKPDPEIDAFMKATALSGQKTSLVTDYVIKVSSLSICLFSISSFQPSPIHQNPTIRELFGFKEMLNALVNSSSALSGCETHMGPRK